MDEDIFAHILIQVYGASHKTLFVTENAQECISRYAKFKTFPPLQEGVPLSRTLPHAASPQ